MTNPNPGEGSSTFYNTRGEQLNLGLLVGHVDDGRHVVLQERIAQVLQDN